MGLSRTAVAGRRGEAVRFGVYSGFPWRRGPGRALGSRLRPLIQILGIPFLYIFIMVICFIFGVLDAFGNLLKMTDVLPRVSACMQSNGGSSRPLQAVPRS